MAKIDLDKYFNQLPLIPGDYFLLGACLGGVDYISAFAHFGGAPFPALGNAIMSAVSRILRDNGMPNAFLTDDLFLCGATQEECMDRLERAVVIITKLGLKLQRRKLTLPCQRITFLGVTIDSVQQRLSIPEDRLQQYAITTAAFQAAAVRGALWYKQLESLVGKLAWVSEVMLAGRARLHRIRSCLYLGKANTRQFAHITLPHA